MHEPEIRKIIKHEFHQDPKIIERLTTGTCNEVYKVILHDKKVIARLSLVDKFIKGSTIHIPLFKSKGIKVPDILAEDYSKVFSQYSYQILSEIEGEDIERVIAKLDDNQLKVIAREIASIILRLKNVPTNGRVGVEWGDDSELTSSWLLHMEQDIKIALSRGKQTGVFNWETETILINLFNDYKSYFENVEIVTYFADMSSKNVMIHNGFFVGLVDLDSLVYGDYLEGVGRIKACWYGTHYSQVYSEAIMDALKLSAEQRKIVTMYALYNRLFWLSENGIQFNQNTSTEINWDNVNESKKIVYMLKSELLG